MHANQSQESIYLRFFAPLPRLSDKDMRRFTHVDYRERVALVMHLGDALIAIARYDRVGGPEGTDAEVAFTRNLEPDPDFEQSVPSVLRKASLSFIDSALLLHLRHLLHDVVHRFTGMNGLIGAQCHRGHAALNQFLDLMRCLGRALRQGTHLAGHHGKAPALLTCACCFHGSVESQDIRLEGNAVDDVVDVSNAR